MYVIEAKNFDLGYQESLKLLLSNGTEISPRNIKTLELSPFVFRLFNPRTRIITNSARNANLGFNILEFLSMISGDDSVEKLATFVPSIAQFSDDGKVFRGSYGSRLRGRNEFSKNDQFDNVISRLKSDKDSRQAVMTIFNPTFDYVKTKDVPCTVMFHFLIRNNKLNMNVYMRSNDAILGHVIDVFSFTMIQEVIANELNVELGEYNHFVGSFHLYEKDIEKAKKIVDANVKSLEMPKMIGGLRKAERTFNKFDDFSYPEKYVNIFKEDVLDEYWNDLFLTMKYQLHLKEKERNKIDINKITSTIYKKYFERKLYGKAKDE